MATISEKRKAELVVNTRPASSPRRRSIERNSKERLLLKLPSRNQLSWLWLARNLRRRQSES